MSARALRSTPVGCALIATLACSAAPSDPEQPVVVAAPATVATAPTAAPVAAAPAEQVATEPPATRSAADYQVDGIRLGDDYAAKVMSRKPYDSPCDNDPIDERARRFMIYGGKPCRGQAFPEGTTVMFYLKFAQSDRYAQPIEVIAWLGGTYYEQRSEFPLRVGQRADEAAPALGRVEAELEITRGKGKRIVARRHPGAIYSLADGAKLCGFVLGPMPDDPQNEQWTGLMQMYERYTDPP